MLKKLASDAFGLSDIGTIISPKDFGKVDADDYIMNEDDEKIYFLIKSKTDEYCFTNMALIHIDGTSAVSKKRTVYRYEYYLNEIRGVTLETAGTMDLDAEIKFTIGDKGFSIDIDKKQIEKLKDLYKALIKISHLGKENSTLLKKAEESIQTSANIVANSRFDNIDVVKSFKALNDYTFNWLLDTRNKYIVKDYGFVFEKYINN